MYFCSFFADSERDIAYIEFKHITLNKKKMKNNLNDIQRLIYHNKT